MFLVVYVVNGMHVHTTKHEGKENPIKRTFCTSTSCFPLLKERYSEELLGGVQLNSRVLV